MTNRGIAIFVAAVLLCLTPAASHALNAYSQDFEGLVQSDTSALGNDGWLVFANVFAPDGVTYYYNYGPFPAPNQSGGFCNIAAGEGGPSQGAQQLVVFSDYNNTDHQIGNVIESNVFQEQMIGPGDVGETWTFNFDAKLGDLAGSSTALAFIKTLDPNNGYALTNFITVDMTHTPTTWTGYSVPFMIDAILQFGFLNKAANYEASGVFYDNVSFYISGVVPTRGSSWGEVKALFH
jgi:hypothetical protein